MLGYTAAELSAYTYTELTHPHDQAISVKLFKELVNQERESYCIDKRYKCKDGQYRWGRMTASLLKDSFGAPQYVIAMIEDITAGKELEAELIEVQHRLMHSREMERLQLAQKLHDGPLQEVIGVSYQLRALENNADQEYNLNQLKNIQASLDLLAENLKKIAADLRPPSLVSFGLEKAIRAHAREIQLMYPQLRITLKLAEDRQLLTADVSVNLFRIYQECIKNILRHSGAEAVWVRFLLDEEVTVLEIQDDGRGFNMPNRRIELARSGRLGLVGAFERAEAMGGTLTVESMPKKGTRIRVIVPRNHDMHKVEESR
jgi:PAS domain S-box-containing protein